VRNQPQISPEQVTRFVADSRTEVVIAALNRAHLRLSPSDLAVCLRSREEAVRRKALEIT
jgi:hypothetical protein